MAFGETAPIRNKICFTDRILEQINIFNCLGYNKGEKDLKIKIVNFVKNTRNYKPHHY
jgi:hypothetical protein